MLSNAELIKRLAESDIYRDYEKAFNDATGLPLALRPRETWRHALSGKRKENPFCALMAKSSRTCAACLENQEKLSAAAAGGAASATCFAGLCDTAIPVRIGDQLAGYLQTGQVALKKPSRAGFNKVTRQLLQWGSQVDLRQLEENYFHSKVLNKNQYEAMIRLLEIFARHLGLVANQAVTTAAAAEPPMITRAKEHIARNAGEDLSLADMARMLNMSTYHFCKTFHKATRLTFTEYLARTRIEKARNLLMNPNLRISEIAYDCGFGSLGHFNRSFKRVAGMSPSKYRQGLARSFTAAK